MIRHFRFEAYFELLYPFWVFDSSELWKSITVCPWLPLVASDSHWFSGCMAWWVFGWMGELMVGPCQITKNGINLDWLSLPCKRSPVQIWHPTAETHLGNSDWLPCWPSGGQRVSHQRWISGNIHHIHLCQVRIRLSTLALKPRDVTRSLKWGYQ